MAGSHRFSFGPWNIHEGADPFGPAVRETIPFSKKLKLFKPSGYDGVQFHDDDAVPGLNDLSTDRMKGRHQVMKLMTVAAVLFFSGVASAGDFNSQVMAVSSEAKALDTRYCAIDSSHGEYTSRIDTKSGFYIILR